MKCVFCKVPLVEKRMVYKEYDIPLGTFPTMICPRCEERFFTAETARKIQIESKAKGLFGLSKKVKVGKIGDSLMIRIPKEIAQLIKLKAGHEVRMHPSGNKIVIEQ